MPEKFSATEGDMSAVLSALENIQCRVAYVPGANDPLSTRVRRNKKMAMCTGVMRTPLLASIHARICNGRVLKHPTEERQQRRWQHAEERQQRRCFCAIATPAPCSLQGALSCAHTDSTRGPFSSRAPPLTHLRRNNARARTSTLSTTKACRG